jgi:hypothetical protein
MLRQIGITALGIIALSSGFAFKPEQVQADIASPRCSTFPVNAPRPRGCTITSFPEGSTTPPVDSLGESPDPYRASGRSLGKSQEPRV